jgi:hypothetical protein
MRIAVPHITSNVMISNNFKFATNVRHLTLISQVHKKPDCSINIACKHILPLFEQLKTLQVEFLFPNVIFHHRDEDIARKECKAFMPKLDVNLKMTGEWMQKETTSMFGLGWSWETTLR